MNPEKYPKELFLDLKKHTNFEKLHDPMEICHISDLNTSNLKKGDFQLIIVRDEPILAHVSVNDFLFFYTKNIHFLKSLREHDNNCECIILPTEEFVFRILHVVIIDILGLDLFQKPYDKNRDKFINKLYYYLEIPVMPIDPVKPDLSAVSIESFRN